MNIVTSKDGTKIAYDQTGQGPPNAILVSKKGLGHTKQLNAGLIAAELKNFFQ
ncbi:hypothetical protein [Cohnella soli]|uniref:Alpha/beta hydrolase n=1 Tax=Cohnella soli TaxID=425005 RepID=A0ABW0HZ41_9BACL